MPIGEKVWLAFIFPSTYLVMFLSLFGAGFLGSPKYDAGIIVLDAVRVMENLSTGVSRIPASFLCVHRGIAGHVRLALVSMFILRSHAKTEKSSLGLLSGPMTPSLRSLWYQVIRATR
jgi:hypothetical protein